MVATVAGPASNAAALAGASPGAAGWAPCRLGALPAVVYGSVQWFGGDFGLEDISWMYSRPQSGAPPDAGLASSAAILIESGNGLVE